MAKLDKLELVVVGDEAEAVFLQITKDLLGLGESGEAFAGRFDFNGSAFGALVGVGLGVATVGDGKEAAVWKACSAGAGMSDEDDAWLEGFADSVEEIGKRGLEGGLSGVGTE